MKPDQAQPQPKLKKAEIDIKDFNVVLIPTKMGSIAQMIWGLGSDNKMYQYDSNLREWIEA